MTVENIDVIDGLGIAKETGEVVLTISDHLPWDLTVEHFAVLERKLGQYLNFIQSGQLLDSVPSADVRNVKISIICKYLPNDAASNFLRAAERQLGELGVKLSFETLPSGY